MSPTSRKKSSLKIYAPLIMPMFFLVLVVIGGWMSWNWIKALNADDPRAGKTPVPATRNNIPAYTKISREHLRVIYLNKSKLPKTVYFEFSDVIGRVLAKDKKAGYVFTEKDFLAEGTRAGLAGAIPPGKRAFTIETEKVQGLFGLNRGDYFDLMGIFKLESDNNFQVVGAQKGMNQSIAEPSVIVRRAQILIPIRTRQETYSQTSLTQGSQMRSRAVRETVIAITPREVQSLAQAISMEAELYVVPVSDTDSQSVDDGDQGSFYSKLNVVETLKGGKRTRVAVPGS